MNIKQQLKQFKQQKFDKFCESKEECNGCTFNHDLGDLGEECVFDNMYRYVMS